MSRWFRLYSDLLDDPKCQSLGATTFKTWINLLCIASKSEGKIDEDALPFRLRMKPREVRTHITSLKEAGLLDVVGDTLTPHNWEGRQYVSDTSSDRVKRHREKRTAAGLKAQWQPSDSARKEVYSRDNFACVYCGSANDLTIDHKTPEQRGGTNEVSNLQTACRACNASKRDLTHEEFLKRFETAECNVTETVIETAPDYRDRTEQNREERKSPAPNGATKSLREKPDTALYRRGKEILGPKLGGKVIKALIANTGELDDVRRKLIRISESADPAAYATAILRGYENPIAADDWIT